MLYVSATALPADKAMVSTIISAAVSISIRRLMAFTSFLWSWCTLQTGCLNICVTKWWCLVGVAGCPVASLFTELPTRQVLGNPNLLRHEVQLRARTTDV